MAQPMRSWAVALLLVAALLIVAACSAGSPTGPQQAGTAVGDQGAGVLSVFATDTPIWTPTPTLTPTPTSTPTPLPTPTPVAALSIGSLPAGQVLFSTQRSGETAQQLWQISPDAGLAELRNDVQPGGWRCSSSAPVICAFVAIDQGLFSLVPVTGTVTLLDDLTPVRIAADDVAISPAVLVTSTLAISPALAITGTAEMTATPDLMGTALLSPTVAVTTTPGITATQPLSPPVLAFSPNGDRLAVATQAQVAIYDLAAPTLLAVLEAGGPAELAWAPDGQQLALAYPAGAGNAVALWTLDDGRLRVLAQMEAAGRLAWAPDGSKLAFDARTSPGTPSSQGGQPDVYVLYLRSGEIANLTEVFLRNNGVDPSRQIGGWAAQWEPDSATVRYLRGIPGQVEEQDVVRHPLRSRSPTVLWPASDEGELGIVADPTGTTRVRVILRDGRDVLQVSLDGGPWQDASPGTFVDLTAVDWAPADDGSAGASRPLMLADRQTLWVIDPATGNLSGLAAACADCVVTQASWLP